MGFQLGNRHQSLVTMIGMIHFLFHGYIWKTALTATSIVRKKWGQGSERMKLNGPGRQDLARNSWQWVKHSWLYSELPQAFMAVLGFGGLLGSVSPCQLSPPLTVLSLILPIHVSPTANLRNRCPLPVHQPTILSLLHTSKWHVSSSV